MFAYRQNRAKTFFPLLTTGGAELAIDGNNGSAGGGVLSRLLAGSIQIGSMNPHPVDWYATRTSHPRLKKSAW